MMTNNERKEHLWIADEEVIRLDKTLTARTTPRNISFSEHGQKLSHSLQAVKEIIDRTSKVEFYNEALKQNILTIKNILFRW